MEQSPEAAIHITYREDAAPFAMNLHHHTSHELILVTAGRVRFHVADREYEASAGDLLVISNLEPHDVEVLEWPYHRFFVSIAPATLQDALREPELETLFRHRPDAFRHLIRLSAPEQNQAEATLSAMAREQADRRPFWEGSLEMALRGFLITLYRSHAASFPQLALSAAARTMLEVQRYIDGHDTEDLRLSEVARRFHVDMYHLSHTFHRTTGYSFKEYLVRCRVNRAADQLRSTADSVSQIASACGFNSAPHFIRTFRRITGITPLQYRKKA